MATKTYDPAKINLIVNGFPLAGFQDGELLTLTYDEDQFSVVMGADGEAVVVMRRGTLATLTVNLLHTSKSNDFLSALYNLAMKTDVSAAIVGLMLQDKSTATTIATSSAVITKLPDTSYDKTVTNRAWVLKVINPESFIGGVD